MKFKLTQIKNLYSTIYLVIFTLILILYVTLVNKTPTAIIQITSRSQTCQLLEVFTNSLPEVSSNAKNYHLLRVIPNDEYSTYSIIVPLPLRYLRIDPCEKKQESEISKISIQSQGITQSISLEPNTFTCHNCALSIEQNVLKITALNNDPIMVTDTLEDQILTMNAKVNMLFVLKNIVIPTITLLLICTSFLFMFKHGVLPKLTMLMSLTICGALASRHFNLHINLKDKFNLFKNLFPIPQIGSQHIVGFAQYNGYPLYFEMWLFILFLLVPIIISLLIFIYAKSRNQP